MRKILLALALFLTALGASAQPARVYSQAELDALLAPVALYPDTVLSNVLVAATQPQQVQEAAAWSRANPQLSGDQAVQVASAYGWHPSVTALVAFPDLLARMQESPQWVTDLGYAYAMQEPMVMETVQQLRLRAQASGYLHSDTRQQVYTHGNRVVIQPVYPQYVVLPYYNPVVVYGTWWWPAYRPVYWRPWHARTVHHAWRPTYYWHPNPHRHWQPPQRVHAAPASRIAVRVPEAQRRPIVHSAPAHVQMPAASAFSHHPRPAHVERREARGNDNGRGNDRGRDNARKGQGHRRG